MKYHHCRIDDELHDRGLSKTTPRHQIVELFEKNMPWSAKTIAMMVHAIGRATIYRNLRVLVKKGVIVPIDAHGEHTFYERAGQPHHDHARCSTCDIIECLPCPIPDITSNHTLEIMRICPTCNA